MFSLTRTTAQRVPRAFIRPFSEVARTEPQHEQAPPPVVKAGPSHGRSRVAKRAKDLPTLSSTKVPVPEDHGLYAFFRRKNNNATGEARYEVVETPEQGQLATGRAWEASELRNKSFKDLHTLWYVVLREKNLLATQKEEARRMGVTNTTLQVPMDKVRQCRKTMARIKAVLNERRLAYEGAVQLAQEEADLSKRALERRQQERKPEKGRKLSYDVHDRQILLIQQPKGQRKPKAQGKNREERAKEPEQEANPWTSHRAYGNYRTSQIAGPGNNKPTPRRRRGVPKAKRVAN